MRIDPVSAPYDESVATALEPFRVGPDGEPMNFFRVLIRNRPLYEALLGCAGYGISKRSSLSVRDREILVLRLCARTRCEYEWGAHVWMWSERAGLGAEQINSTVLGDA